MSEIYTDFLVILFHSFLIHRSSTAVLNTNFVDAVFNQMMSEKMYHFSTQNITSMPNIWVIRFYLNSTSLCKSFIILHSYFHNAIFFPETLRCLPSKPNGDILREIFELFLNSSSKSEKAAKRMNSVSPSPPLINNLKSHPLLDIAYQPLFCLTSAWKMMKNAFQFILSHGIILWASHSLSPKWHTAQLWRGILHMQLQAS